MSKPFTAEQCQWLIDNYGCTYRELTERFNERFGTSFQYNRDGYSPIERKCKRMGLSRSANAYGFTDKEDDWLREYAARYSSQWLADHITAVSGRKHSAEAIKMHVREWLDIHKGNGGIREDTVQTYKKPIGSICSWGGSARIKVQDTGDDKKDWESLPRYMWEKHNGRKLPRGMQVVFANGDRTDYSKQNLVAVTHAEHAIMSAYKWHGKGELTIAGASCARLQMTLKERGVNVQEVTKQNKRLSAIRTGNSKQG